MIISNIDGVQIMNTVVKNWHCSGQLILATVLESWYLTSDSFGAKPAL